MPRHKSTDLIWVLDCGMTYAHINPCRYSIPLRVCGMNENQPDLARNTTSRIVIRALNRETYQALRDIVQQTSTFCSSGSNNEDLLWDCSTFTSDGSSDPSQDHHRSNRGNSDDGVGCIHQARLAPMWQQSGTLLFCSCHGIDGSLWMNCKSEFGVIFLRHSR